MMPLLKNTLSTGADVAGMQYTCENRERSSGYCCHACCSVRSSGQNS